MSGVKLKEAIEEFLLAMEAGNRAEKTLRWYRQILERFADRGGQLSPAAIRRYLAARRKEIRPASLAGEDRALRRFCRWLVDQGTISDDPMRRVDRQKETESFPRIAGADVAMRLAAVAGHRDSPYALRDRALVLVLADTGARLSEFLAITMDNLRVVHRDGSEHGEAWVIGKGRRRRRLLIGSEAMTALAAWIVERPEEAGPVIWWGDRGALQEWGVRMVLRRLSKAAGIPNVNPHAFRHGAAIDAIQAGADVRTVQILLGHTQIQTTVRYLHLADQMISDAHDRISEARFAALRDTDPTN